MTKSLAALTILFANIVLVSLHPSRPRLPQCSSSKSGGQNIDLLCLVSRGQFLDYNDIRAFTKGRPDKQKFNITIECSEGGVIHLPYPFSAKNVISLQVSGCETVGLISEMFDQYPYPNELQQVSLIDMKHRLTVKELHDTLYKHDYIPVEYDCGLSNVMTQISRNINYIFPTPSNSFEEMMMMEELLSSNSLEKLLSHSNVCVYPNLKYLEESGLTSFSLVRFKIMESSSRYPELQYYDLGNNSIPVVPKELRNLDISFLPKLYVLDLSDNTITDANFFYKGQVPKALVVNLRRNRIRSITKGLVDDIIRAQDMLLDLRENPLQCNCDLFRYADHLKSLQGNWYAREIYMGMTCEQESRGILERHHVTETGLGQKLCV